ncbi:MAG: hypothetical protein R2761_02205 [Acidimicrobiales bacterium]
MTEIGTTTSDGMWATAATRRVRSTSATSSFTLESARLRMRWSFSVGMSSRARVLRPIFTFLMLGMSRPATSTMSSDASMIDRTTSLKMAGVSTTT